MLKGETCMAHTPASKEEIMLSGSALLLLQYGEFKGQREQQVKESL